MRIDIAALVFGMLLQHSVSQWADEARGKCLHNFFYAIKFIFMKPPFELTVTLKQSCYSWSNHLQTTFYLRHNDDKRH